jgi:hypothetical protein
LTLCEEFPAYDPSLNCTITAGTTTNYGPNEFIQDKNFLVLGLWTINTQNSLIFQNCNFKMAPGALILLNCNDNLIMTYTGCKFFTCDQMWQGIDVKYNFSFGVPGVGQTPRFSFTDCHIEDAASALQFNQPSPLVQFYIESSIFNNNYIGLQAAKDVVAPLPGTTPVLTNMNLSFLDNVLGTTQPLRPFYTSTPPNGWPLAFTGLLLGNINPSLPIGVPASGNSFSRMTNGIVCRSAHLDISNNSFTTLWRNGILARVGNLKVFDNTFIAESALPNGQNPPIMQNGIYALSCDLDIQFNKFKKRLRHGINSRLNQHGEFISILQNSFSDAIVTNLPLGVEHCGICLERSAASPSAGILAHNSIGSNDFDITTKNYTAIVVEGANTASDVLSVSRNFPITLENLPPFNFVKGIYVRTMNAENTDIGGNKVYINGYYQSGNFGILTFTSNAVNFSIHSNLVNGISDPALPNTEYSQSIESAIYLRNANDANADVCNNLTDNSQDGLHFARGMAEVRENKIFNHSNGIFIEPYELLPMLGLQDGRGNQWLGSYVKFAAIRQSLTPGSSALFPQLCRFWVPESNLPPFLPTSSLISPDPNLEPNPFLKWFKFDADLELDYCTEGFAPPGTNEFEMKVAEGLMTDLPSAKIWDAKRNLYRKLIEEPGLLIGNPVLLAFKNTFQGSHLATFSQADMLIRNATRFTAAAQESRDNIILGIGQKEAQVKTLLTAIHYDLSVATDAQFQSLTALESQISADFDSRSALDLSKDQQIASYLDVANVANEALQPINVQEQARKDLNRLIIKNLRHAIETDEDYQVILNIAGQPENLVGDAVQEAVLLLKGCDQNDFLSKQVEEVANRDGAIKSSQPSLKSIMQVFPNPSDGYFQVLLTMPVSGFLRIMDATGKTVQISELLKVIKSCQKKGHKTVSKNAVSCS